MFVFDLKKLISIVLLNFKPCPFGKSQALTQSTLTIFLRLGTPKFYEIINNFKQAV